MGRASCLTALTDGSVVVRFPAGPQVSFKTVDPPKSNGLGQKKACIGRESRLPFGTGVHVVFKDAVVN